MRTTGVERGIPQGSSLGPILFFGNDLPNDIESTYAIFVEWYQGVLQCWKEEEGCDLDDQEWSEEQISLVSDSDELILLSKYRS